MGNIGALIFGIGFWIGIGFWGPFYHNYKKELIGNY